MRLTLSLLMLSGMASFAVAAEPAPPPRELDVLKRLEGEWVLKSALAAVPDGLRWAELDGPNAQKVVLSIRDGVHDLTADGKPVPNMRSTLKLGTEAECLLLYGRPGQKPFKVRFRLDGDTLVVVQDHAFLEECPDSFDALKGRGRDRRIMAFTREPKKP